MLLLHAGLNMDWAAVLADVPISSVSNWEMGLRAQVETCLMLNRQQAPAAATAESAVAEQEIAVCDRRVATVITTDAAVAAAAAAASNALHYTSKALHHLHRLKPCVADLGAAKADATGYSQQSAALVSVLLTSLKIHQALAQMDSHAEAALGLGAYAALILETVGCFNCNLQIGVDDNNQLWDRCMTLAARSCIAAGGSTARLIENGRSKRPSGGEVGVRTSHAAQISVWWCDVTLQQTVHEVTWIHQQLTMLQQQQQGVTLQAQISRQQPQQQGRLHLTLPVPVPLQQHLSVPKEHSTFQERSLAAECIQVSRCISPVVWSCSSLIVLQAAAGLAAVAV